ncbi:tripartite tricarboxylate transporter TctB family protein [Fusobacterium sp.]|jgi:putative tricarboxylic transport membrane protein|uniref:tripartite tricarboxylate transporter TctB family protein n=1 Tax=Fusobacterium sp. TaxID=68766 RepID=UPI000C70FFE2|nr:tripartite tricarboxylate transporter TctB family protein [Fusobacterium sp.]
MKYKIKVNLVGGFIFLIVSIVLWYCIPFQIPEDKTSMITSRTFPELIIIIMFLSSCILFFSDVIKLLRKKKVAEIEIDLNEEGRAVIICLLLIAYVFLFTRIGFLFSSILFSYGMLIFFRCKNWKYYVTLTILPIIITYIFKYLLMVQLP